MTEEKINGNLVIYPSGTIYFGSGFFYSGFLIFLLFFITGYYFLIPDFSGNYFDNQKIGYCLLGILSIILYFYIKGIFKSLKTVNRENVEKIVFYKNKFEYFNYNLGRSTIINYLDIKKISIYKINNRGIEYYYKIDAYDEGIKVSGGLSLKLYHKNYFLIYMYPKLSNLLDEFKSRIGKGKIDYITNTEVFTKKDTLYYEELLK